MTDDEFLQLVREGRDGAIAWLTVTTFRKSDEKKMNILRDTEVHLLRTLARNIRQLVSSNSMVKEIFTLCKEAAEHGETTVRVYLEDRLFRWIAEDEMSIPDEFRYHRFNGDNDERSIVAIAQFQESLARLGLRLTSLMGHMSDPVLVVHGW